MLGQLGVDQGVNAGTGLRFDGLKRPVFAPLGALIDPGLEQLLLLLGERAMRLRWWHHIIFIRGDQSGPNLAVGRIARRDGSFAFAGGLGGGFIIEPQLGFAMLFIRAVAEEALLR